MCLALHGDVRGDCVVSALWSTSELTVCDSVLGLTPGLHARVHRSRAVQGRAVPTAVSEVRGRHLFLRKVFTPFRQAP